MRATVSGFTLLEVLAALTIAGIVVLGGHRVLSAALDARDRQAAAERAGAERARGLPLIRVLVANTRTPARAGRRFEGTPERVDFETWCRTGTGAFAPCHAALRVLETAPGGIELVIDGESGAHLALGAARPAFEYQQRGGRDERWDADWGTSFTLPTAIRIVAAPDTIVLPLAVDR